eukprot:3941512-Rhodomonas_salina.3
MAAMLVDKGGKAAKNGGDAAINTCKAANCSAANNVCGAPVGGANVCGAPVGREGHGGARSGQPEHARRGRCAELRGVPNCAVKSNAKARDPRTICARNRVSCVAWMPGTERAFGATSLFGRGVCAI